jgi:hypothetical protein
MAMYPPVQATAAASGAVTALLGTAPNLRLYIFGEANQNTPRPYAVWQTVSGSPYNYLADIPDTDRYTVQIDVYATTVAAARAVAQALRAAFEPVAYVVSWRGESKDQTTGVFRVSFDTEWHEYR